MEITTMGWVFLTVGFVPWQVVCSWHSRRHGRGRQEWRSFTVQAIFWQLKVEQRPHGIKWQLTLPLIARSKAAVWAVLRAING